MTWLNDHSQAEESGHFVYRCTDPECTWKSPALLANIRPEIVSESRHPQHRVELDTKESHA